ncbi:hypothetical protein TNCV_4452751 [Trichonephila clavipes]|nr:hypothetical protein TNCV_4452751 [Trichonephila clavipes]
MKRFDQKAYKLHPSTPARVPAETNKRPLEQPGACSKRNRVFITPVIRPPVTRYQTFHCLGHPSTYPPVPIPPQPPVQIPVTFEQTTPQILLPDPPPVQIPDPPVVETLEPSLMDDSSIYQIMSSVFGDCYQQWLPPAHTQEPQLLETVPSLLYKSNDLISFLDHFETGLTLEQQETPMDLTVPRVKKKVRKTIGFKVIKPLDLSVRNCLPCM